MLPYTVGSSESSGGSVRGPGLQGDCPWGSRTSGLRWVDCSRNHVSSGGHARHEGATGARAARVAKATECWAAERLASPQDYRVPDRSSSVGHAIRVAVQVLVAAGAEVDLYGSAVGIAESTRAFCRVPGGCRIPDDQRFVQGNCAAAHGRPVPVPFEGMSCGCGRWHAPRGWGIAVANLPDRRRCPTGSGVQPPGTNGLRSTVTPTRDENR